MLSAEQILKKQNAVKQKAKQLEKNLLKVREQKLDQFKKELRDRSVDDMQHHYQQFKIQFDQFSSEQIEMLKLEKEMKLMEVEEIQEQIKGALNQLEFNREKIQNMKQQITKAEKQAIQHLEMNRTIQIQQLQEQFRGQIEEKVKQFEESIYIE